MRTLLRTVAICFAAAALIFWSASGANRGWTRTTVTRMEIEPVTGLSTPVVTKRFVPGIEFLGGALTLSAGLFAFSWLFRKAAPPDRSLPPQL